MVNAPYPFDFDTADITLRTLDQVDFRVGGHRAILAIVLPVLATMFRLPQPGVLQGNDAGPTSLPVVDISEDSKTLDTILRLCYSVPKEETEETDNVILALSAAIKYDMEWPVSIFTKKLEDVAFRNPLAHLDRRGARTRVVYYRSTRLQLFQHTPSVKHNRAASVTVPNHPLHRPLSPNLSEEHLEMASFPEPPQTTDASHLFNRRRPSTDVILRSCDLVDFYTHTLILAEASPFFSDMFRLPQPQVGTGPVDTADATRALPIIDMSEDAETLDLLLRLLYPILKPHMEEPKVLASVLKAATKYDMVWPAAVVSERLLAITPDKALQVWVAVCQVRTGLEDVARQAADVIKASWTPQANKEVLTLLDGVGDMRGISAGDYYRLKRFLLGMTVPALLSPQASEPGTVAVKTPISPFATDLPDADLKCQPSSRHGPPTPFFAHQLMLSSHSLVLKRHILSLQATTCPTSSSHGTDLMVLDFDEEADVVSDLLAVCYGGEDDLPTDLTRIAGLLAASQKYGMTRVARWTRRAWDAAAALKPLEAYFVALEHGLKECTEAAARYVLATPILDDYVAAMEKAPALAYHQLLKYYDTCHQVVREQLIQASDRIPDHLSTSHLCQRSDGGHRGTRAYYMHERFSRTAETSITIHATDIVTPLKDLAHTARPGEGLRKVLRDTVIQAGLGCIGTFDLSNFAAALVQYVISTPDEIELALDAVKISITQWSN